MNHYKHSEDIFTIPNFFTPKECLHWINFSEAQGYEAAKVGGSSRQVLMPHIRNNERLIYDSQSLALDLWKKLEPYIPSKIGNATAIGLNERFRFYKYAPGQRFKRHQDGSFIRSKNEWSMFTFMVYLNEEMVGGETEFHQLTIQPERGMALVFRHQLSHEGCAIKQGIKYVLRSDVMFRFEG